MVFNRASVDADPEYAVAEVVAVRTSAHDRTCDSDACTLKLLSPYSRGARRNHNNVVPVSLLDNSQWQHGIESESALSIDCASVACTVNLWETVTRPGDPVELWSIDATGLRDAKMEVVGHMEWLSEQ